MTQVLAADRLLTRADMTSEATPVPTTMTALRAHHRGGPEQLVVETAPRPDPGRGELLVEVHAAAITFAELTWDESWTRDGLDRTPVIPSHEFSGVVVGARNGCGARGSRRRRGGLRSRPVRP